MLRLFADVKQTVGTWENLHEGAEICETHDFAEVGLPNFGFRQQVANHLQRLRSRRLVGSGHVYTAVVFDVNLHASLLDDAANDFAARSDQFANP